MGVPIEHEAFVTELYKRVPRMAFDPRAALALAQLGFSQNCIPFIASAVSYMHSYSKFGVANTAMRTYHLDYLTIRKNNIACLSSIEEQYHHIFCMWKLAERMISISAETIRYRSTGREVPAIIELLKILYVYHKKNYKQKGLHYITRNLTKGDKDVLNEYTSATRLLLLKEFPSGQVVYIPKEMIIAIDLDVTISGCLPIYEHVVDLLNTASPTAVQSATSRTFVAGESSPVEMRSLDRVKFRHDSGSISTPTTPNLSRYTFTTLSEIYC